LKGEGTDEVPWRWSSVQAAFNGTNFPIFSSQIRMRS